MKTQFSKFKAISLCALFLTAFFLSCGTAGDSDGDDDDSPNDAKKDVCMKPDLSAWPQACIPENSMGKSYIAKPERAEHKIQEITVEFNKHFLTSLDGMPCKYCDLWRNAPAEYSTTEYYNCSVYYSCGEGEARCAFNLTVGGWGKRNWQLFGPSEQDEHSDNPKCKPYIGQYWELAEAKEAAEYCRPKCKDYGKPCGSDGCGGSCGTCPSGEECNDGLCEKPGSSDCPAKCRSPSGLTCCEPPFCSGECAGSPCC